MYYCIYLLRMAAAFDLVIGYVKDDFVNFMS